MFAGDAISLNQFGCFGKHCNDARHLASHWMQTKMDTDRLSQRTIVDCDGVTCNHACVFQSAHSFCRAWRRQSDFLSKLAYRDSRVLSKSQQYRAIERIDGPCDITASVHDPPHASCDSTTFVGTLAPELILIPAKVCIWMPREPSTLSMVLHF